MKTLVADLEILMSAPLFAAMDLADKLAAMLDVKAARNGRGATREEKDLRVMLTTAMNEAAIDTIQGGSYVFTIDTEVVVLTAEDGSKIEAEMDLALKVHRSTKTTAKASQRVSNRPTLSMRSAMSSVLSDAAPLSGIVPKAA